MSASTNTKAAQKKINEQYAAQLTAQNKQLEANYGQGRQDYGKQIAEAGKQYQGMRNQAYADNAMAEQSRKENMANMGMSGAGGTSQTLQQRNQTAMLDTVGAANRQQQDYTDNIKLALGNLTTKYNADLYSAKQQNTADKIGAQTAYSQWQSQFDLSRQQLEQQKLNDSFERYTALYKSGRLRRDQYKQMVEELLGIKLK